MMRFAKHEEVLALRGWSSLHWRIGVQQRICIRRTPDAPDPQRLTSTEFALAGTVAVGRAVKEAAAELGLEWTTARTALSRALRKLGARSCAHLPALWHGLSVTAASCRDSDGMELLVFESRLDADDLTLGLTGAERAVLQAVLTGQDNSEIARQRNASVRTVANQLAALFRKFDVSCKGELAAKALRLDAGGELSRSASRNTGTAGAPRGAATAREDEQRW